MSPSSATTIRAPTVEDATHHAPLARRELVRPVHVRVAEVRGGRVVLEHQLLGARDAVALLVVARVLDRRRVLGRSAPGARAGRTATGSSNPGTRARRRPTRTGRHPPVQRGRCGAAARTSRTPRRRCARRVAAVNAASSNGIGVHVLDDAGVSARSCVPRCRIVTSWPRSTSSLTSGMPVGPVPPMTRTRSGGLTTANDTVTVEPVKSRTRPASSARKDRVEPVEPSNNAKPDRAERIVPKGSCRKDRAERIVPKGS